MGGGIDSHMVLIDLKDRGIEAREAEKLFEMMSIICNQNSIPGDRPGGCTGLRLGIPPMVFRGMSAADFGTVAAIIHQGLELMRLIHEQSSQTTELLLPKVTRLKRLEQFIETAQSNPLVGKLRSCVAEMVCDHPPPWHRP